MPEKPDLSDKQPSIPREEGADRQAPDSGSNRGNEKPSKWPSLNVRGAIERVGRSLRPKSHSQHLGDFNTDDPEQYISYILGLPQLETVTSTLQGLIRKRKEDKNLAARLQKNTEISKLIDACEKGSIAAALADYCFKHAGDHGDEKFPDELLPIINDICSAFLQGNQNAGSDSLDASDKDQAEKDKRISGAGYDKLHKTFVDLRRELVELLEKLNTGTDQPAINIQYDVGADEDKTEGQAELILSSAENEDLKKTIRGMRQQKEGLEQQVKDLKSEKSQTEETARQAAEEAGKTITYLESEITRLSGVYDSCLLDELKKIKELNGQIETLEAELETARKTADDEGARADKSENERDDLNTEIGAKTAELEKARSDIYTANENADAEKERANKLDGQVIGLRAQLESANGRADTEKQRADGLQGEVGKINVELQKQTEESGTAIAGLRQQVSELNERIGILKDELDSASKRVIEVESEKDAELTEKIEEAGGIIQGLATSLEVKKKAIVVGKASQLETASKISELEGSVVKLSEKISAAMRLLKIRKTNAETEIAKLTAELEEAVKDISRLQSEKADLSSRLETQNAWGETLEENLTEKNTELENALETASEDKNTRELLIKLQKLAMEGKNVKIAGLRQQIGELNGQIGQLRTDLQSADGREGAEKSRADGLQADVTRLSGELEQQAKELSERIQALERELQSANSRAGSLEEDKAELKRQLEAADSRANTQKERADGLDDQLTESREKIRSANTRADGLECEKTALEETARRAAEEAGTAITGLEQQVGELNRQIGILETQLETAKKTADDESVKTNELADKVYELRLRVDELKSDLDEANKQLLSSSKKIRKFESQKTVIDRSRAILVDDDDVEFLGANTGAPGPMGTDDERIPTIPPPRGRGGWHKKSKSATPPKPDKQPEPDEAPEPEKTVFKIFWATTVPKGQHLTIKTLKNIPDHTVTVEDGASVTIEKAFAGAIIKLLGANAKYEINEKIGDLEKNPIKIIHRDGTVEEIKK
jgi:chromosome segregation ATPase